MTSDRSEVRDFGLTWKAPPFVSRHQQSVQLQLGRAPTPLLKPDMEALREAGRALIRSPSAAKQSWSAGRHRSKKLSVLFHLFTRYSWADQLKTLCFCCSKVIRTVLCFLKFKVFIMLDSQTSCWCDDDVLTPPFTCNHRTGHTVSAHAW